jgi:hypothetical protein
MILLYWENIYQETDENVILHQRKLKICKECLKHTSALVDSTLRFFFGRRYTKLLSRLRQIYVHVYINIYGESWVKILE